jgi:hypothetical protein
MSKFWRDDTDSCLTLPGPSSCISALDFMSLQFDKTSARLPRLTSGPEGEIYDEADVEPI